VVAWANFIVMLVAMFSFAFLYVRSVSPGSIGEKNRR